MFVYGIIRGRQWEPTRDQSNSSEKVFFLQSSVVRFIPNRVRFLTFGYSWERSSESSLRCSRATSEEAADKVRWEIRRAIDQTYRPTRPSGAYAWGTLALARQTDLQSHRQTHAHRNVARHVCIRPNIHKIIQSEEGSQTNKDIQTDRRAGWSLGWTVTAEHLPIRCMPEAIEVIEWTLDATVRIFHFLLQVNIPPSAIIPFCSFPPLPLPKHEEQYPIRAIVCRIKTTAPRPVRIRASRLSLLFKVKDGVKHWPR